MKFMNAHENPEMGLKEKVLRKVGEHFIKTSASMLSCRLSFAYEPELTPEMIREILNEQD